MRQQSKGFTLIQLMMTLAVIGILGTLSAPSYRTYVERARVARAVGDLGDMEIAIKRFEIQNNGVSPNTLADVGFGGALDPWGNPYQYTNIANGGAPRTDQAALPVNTDYDLVSIGSDGATATGLTTDAAQDDIVRGNDGNYFGLVSDYSRLP